MPVTGRIGDISGHTNKYPPQQQQTQQYNHNNVYTSPSIDQSDQTPPPMWPSEEVSEVSILGNHFAQAVAVVSVGLGEEVLKANKRLPKKKIFFEEPQYNPAIANTHIDHEYDAHFNEEAHYWAKRGTVFPTAKRICQVPQPKKFIKTGPDVNHGEKVFGRTRHIHQLSTRKKLLTESMYHDTSRVEAMKAWTESIGPTTYSISDPWMQLTKPVCGEIPATSAFKSSTQRFKEPPRPGGPRSPPRSPSPSHFTASRHTTPVHGITLPVPALLISPAGSVVTEKDGSHPFIDGKDSWDSFSFDRRGYPSSPPSLASHSPDLVITPLQTQLSTVQDSPVPLVGSPGTSLRNRVRSADIVHSRKPGHSFGRRYGPDGVDMMLPFPFESQGHENILSRVERRDLSSMRVESPNPSPPRSAPAGISRNNAKEIKSERIGSSSNRRRSNPEVSSIEVLPPSSSMSALTHATEESSHLRNIIGRWNPPLCYSKKPLHEKILQEQRELKQLQLSSIEELRSHDRESINKMSMRPRAQTSMDILPRGSHRKEPVQRPYTSSGLL